MGRPRDEPFGTTERPGTELGSFWDQARQTFGLLVLLTLNNLKKIGMSLVPTRFRANCNRCSRRGPRFAAKSSCPIKEESHLLGLTLIHVRKILGSVRDGWRDGVGIIFK